MSEKPAIEVKDDEIIIHDPDAHIQQRIEAHNRGGRPTDRVRLAQGKRSLQPAKGWWPEEKKIEVATLHQAGMRNLTELEQYTGVPAKVIKNWKQTEDWLEILDKINNIVDQDTVSRFNQIVDKSLEVVQDRLINGECYVGKDGELKRRPVSLRDATVASAIIVDKRQLLRGKATSRTERIGTDERLSKLAEEFSRFIKAKDVSPATSEKE